MEAKALIHRIDVRQGCLVWAAALLGRNHCFSFGPISGTNSKPSFMVYWRVEKVYKPDDGSLGT